MNIEGSIPSGATPLKKDISKEMSFCIHIKNKAPTIPSRGFA